MNKKPDSTKKRVAVVGCGYWGKNLVRNFAELGALDAICDHHQERTRKFSAEYGARILEFEDLLGDSAIDAVVIATPGPSHFDLASACLLAGKHVFIEKPMVLSVRNAEKLEQLAQRSGRVVMVGHVLRYHAAFLKMEELVRDGVLGPVRHIVSTRFAMGKILADEDVLWALGPHDLSMVTALLGRKPLQITAQGNDFLRPGILDLATLRLTYEHASAEIRLSWMNPFKEHKLTVIGEKAMAVFDDTQGWERKLAVYRPALDWNDPDVIPAMPPLQPVSLEPSEPLRAECMHFLDSIARNVQPRTNVQEGLAVVRLLEQASLLMQQNSAHLPALKQKAFS